MHRTRPHEGCVAASCKGNGCVMERDSKIIPMGSGEGRRVSNALRGYWEGLRKGRALPARAQVNPRGIEQALEYAFILERVAPGMGRFRLAGMHLSDLMGMEVRGMPLSAFFTPEGRKKICALTECVFADPAIVEVVLRAETGIGKPEMMARLLLLPLTSDFGDVSRALGCLVAEGAHGRTPRRFDVAEIEITPIAFHTAQARPAPLSPDQLVLNESQTPYEHSAALSPAAPGSGRTADEHLCEMTPQERRAMFRIVRARD